jgi:hypothetical protein
VGPLTHEIFHTWGVYGFSAFGLSSVVGGSGHWGPLATPGEDTIFDFPSTLASLTDLGGGRYCGPFANGTSPMGLELYLMGIAPSSEIGRHDFVADAGFTGLSSEPGCNYDFSGSALGTLDASSIEAGFGPRIPAYPDQDQFQIAALVVSDRRLEPIEFDYLARLLQQHEADFSEDLQGLAEVSYFLPEPSSSLMEVSVVTVLLALRRLQRRRRAACSLRRASER